MFWIYDTDRVSSSLFLYYYIDLFCTLTSNHFTLPNQPKCKIKNGACLENTFQTTGMHWDHSIEWGPNRDIWTSFVNNHSVVLCTEGGSFEPMAVFCETQKNPKDGTDWRKGLSTEPTGMPWNWLYTSSKNIRY